MFSHHKSLQMLHLKKRKHCNANEKCWQDMPMFVSSAAALFILQLHGCETYFKNCWVEKGENVTCKLLNFTVFNCLKMNHASCELLWCRTKVSMIMGGKMAKV